MRQQQERNMTNELAIVDTIMDDPSDFTVVATDPAGMMGAQKSLILWCARKIAAIKGEIITAQEQLDIHKKNKWNATAWAREVSKHKKRTEFYRKIKMALEAGYYIVPPFPIDIFAIRTKRSTPHRYDSQNRDNHDQPAQILPLGEGQYVDPKPERLQYNSAEPDGKGGTRLEKYYWASDYAAVDFPFKLARSEIRSATDAAMGLKIFDRLGVLPRQRAPDPIVCGEILFPNQPSYATGQHGTPKGVMFFVAWWLDTKTL
jgi:hypothetical protein